MNTIPIEQYNDFRHYLEKASGILLGENKHYLVSSRLNKVAREMGFDSVSSIVTELLNGKQKDLQEKIVDAMTTNETMWFRDVYPYEILNNHLFPEFARQGRPVKIWSAASSTGQEAYSISMSFSELRASKPGLLNSELSITATDISKTVINMAKKAVYDELSVIRGLSPARRDRFFQKVDDGWQVKDEITRRVRFTELNLLNSFALLGRFQVVFCRNVLIYFSSELKKDILDRVASILEPGGYLVLGGSETPTGYSDRYEMVRFPEGVVYRLKERK